MGASELFGTVSDPAGLPIGGASVRVEQRATGANYAAVTDEHGTWRVFALAPGKYRVAVSSAGFRSAIRDEIEVRLASRVAVEVSLELGEFAESVEVRADPPAVQSATGAISYLTDRKSVLALPLDGRNFVPLIALLPGVALPPGQVLPRINGSRPRVSEYMYDGISVLQPEPGQVAYYPIIDGIEEFRVQTNSYSAEYGRSNGGVIQVATRSGTNEFHGTVFEFFRNEALNARNLFAPAGPMPEFRRNQYGGVVGGPIQNSKTFFFADWQGTRLRTGTTRVSTVPTLNERQGVFAAPVYDPASTRPTESGWARDPFPSNTIPRSRWDAQAAALIDRYPLPVSTGAANNYRRTPTESTDADQFDARIDRVLTAQRLFARYSFLRDDSRPATPLPDGSGAIGSGVIGATLTRSDSVAVEHSWTLSPRAVNELRGGFTTRGVRRRALDTLTARAIANVPLTSFSTVMPLFELAGYQQLGPPSSSNARFDTSVTEVADTYSVSLGKHSVKVGADLRWERLDVLQPPNPTGDFQFSNILTSGLTATGTPATGTGNSVASLLLGQVQAFSVDAQRDMLKPRAAVSEFFVQDDWSATRRLTLNAGVRYTLNWPSTEADNHAAVFNLNTQRLDFLGQNGVRRSARNLEPLNFGPRLGTALRLTDSLVFRAGYGLVWIEQAGITTPFTTPLFPFIQTLDQRSLDNRTPAFVLANGPTVELTAPNQDSGLGGGVFGVQRDNGSGYAQQWNATIQKAFGANWSFEAAYAGSKLTRLGVPDTNLNQLRVEQLAQGSRLTQQVPNPFYGELPPTSSIGGPTVAYQQLLRAYPRFTSVTMYRNNVGHSTYHAFETRLVRRFAAGLTVTASYTFSKLIDDAGAVFDSAVLTGPVINYQAADSFNRRLEKDESTGSIPHVFSAGWVWEPLRASKRRALRGWQIAGIVRLQSGMLIPVTQSTNLNAAFGFGIQRPNRIGDPNQFAERSVWRWFDTAAFVQAPQFTLGSSSRNPVRGPSYQQADLMLGNTFAITERWRAEFRAQVFNITNTPPLGQPNGSFGSAAFGSITTALDPRDFELALKLHF